MKKITLLALTLLGCYSFSQSTRLVINNYSVYNLEGRLIAGSPTTSNAGLIAAPNAPYGSYTVPALMTDIQYNSFDTSGISLLPIDNWYLASGSYPYNHPNVTALVPVAEWATFYFQTKDSAGNNFDDFRIGNPAISGAIGFTSFSSQTGTYSDAEWFDIGGYTYLQVY
ncbi:hypothetical protein [Chryseobacterium sp. JUb7]|uniref:hypothetical protein n=1 Tax=Chryseobacterium sp. JUb7 TaxID=2940599 RepID=UPI002168887D|nr:hypothetical protein [Chryseobacterium sp. JUb7]MCS3531411.1 hypothetical protein [Chryseobacterium sp. JUb7]